MKYKKLFINLTSSPIRLMRYKTLGDWKKEEKTQHMDFFEIITAETGNQDYDFLILLHELVEAYLCHKRGVTQEMVDAFDIKHEELDDPGADESAPYHTEHMKALEIEAAMSVELGVEWKKYEDVQDAILKKYGNSSHRRKANLVEHPVSRRALGKTRKNS